MRLKKLSMRFLALGLCWFAALPSTPGQTATDGLAEAQSRPVAAWQAQQPTKVTFDDESTMYVDGRPMVPVFLWHGGTAQANLAGENLSRQILTDNAQYWRRMKQVPYSFVRVVPTDEAWKNQLETYVPFVKQQPSMLAYFLTHEPWFGKEPPELINEVARTLRRLDPDHPTFVHIAMRAKMYSEDSQILSISSMGINPGLMAIKMSRVQRVTKAEKAIWPCMHPFITNFDQWTTDRTALTDFLATISFPHRVASAE